MSEMGRSATGEFRFAHDRFGRDGGGGTAAPLVPVTPTKPTRLTLGSTGTPYAVELKLDQLDETEMPSAQMLYDAHSQTAQKVVSARFQLNSLGGASQLAALSDSPFWRQWAGSVSQVTLAEMR